MIPNRTVARIFDVVALAAGLLALACPPAWPAGSNQLFTESWNQKWKCGSTRGSSGSACTLVGRGKFDITANFATSLTPSVLSDPSTQFDITLGGGSGGSGTAMTGYYFKDTMSSFTQKVSKNETTAKRVLSTQKCNGNGNQCKNFDYETIVLKITKAGKLEISISAKTGSDLNGDTFENSIDAENFDGDNGPVSGDLYLQVDLGSFSFNDGDSDNVSVTGNATTKSSKTRGSTSVPDLSDVKIGGTLQ